MGIVDIRQHHHHQQRDESGHMQLKADDLHSHGETQQKIRSIYPHGCVSTRTFVYIYYTTRTTNNVNNNNNSYKRSSTTDSTTLKHYFEPTTLILILFKYVFIFPL